MVLAVFVEDTNLFEFFFKLPGHSSTNEEKGTNQASDESVGDDYTDGIRFHFFHKRVLVFISVDKLLILFLNFKKIFYLI